MRRLLKQRSEAMDKLSVLQQRVLEFIESEVLAGRKFPTATAIGAHIGWKSPHSASDALTALVCAGRLIIKDRVLAGRYWKYEYGLAPTKLEAAE